MTSTIYYIGTKESAIIELKKYFKNQHIDLVDYDIRSLPKVKHLLIVEPIYLDDKKRFYAISKLWKQKLGKIAPETHLLVAGYAEGDHCNYLNLLDIPSSILEWLSKTKAVHDFELEYGTKVVAGETIDHYKDPWEKELPLRGIDISSKLKLFFNGHEQSRGLLNQLNNITLDLESASHHLDKKRSPLSFEEIYTKYFLEGILKEWPYFLNRWSNYQPLFDVLPFPDTLIEVNQFVVSKKAYFKALKSEQDIKKTEAVLRDSIKDLKNDFNTLKENLKAKVRRYVFWVEEY